MPVKASVHFRSGCLNRSLLKKNEQGLALLTVMLTLTLAILLAAGVIESMRRQTLLSHGLQNREQGWWYALSAEQLAMKALKQDFKDDKEVVHLGQFWATSRQTFPMEKGSISGQVHDRQGCFNLNSLAIISDSSSPDEEKVEKLLALRVMKALLENYEVDRSAISYATMDWVSEKTQPLSSEGADDDDYLSLPVSYLAGNTYMRDESEWRAVSGVTSSIASKVMPSLCALPSSSLEVNVNTIPVNQPELLAALLLNRISINQAEDLLKERPRNGWRNVADFLNESLLSNIQKQDIEKLFVVKSDFFEVDARAQIENTRVRLRSLLVRGDKNTLTVVRRRTGEVL